LKFEYKFILLYLTIGFLWILISDSLLSSISDDYTKLIQLQNFKGWFYVLATGIIFFIIIKKHLEKLRESEIRARKNDDLKTAFLHNISHEIRTPMNGISGFSDLIKQRMYDSEKELQYYLELIGKSSKRLLNTIEAIVDVSKIESNNIEPDYQSIDLKIFMEEVQELANSLINDNQKLILNTPKSDTDLYILTDKNLLYKVFKSLIHNAVKFAPYGNIEIGYARYNHKIIFFVKDDGIGIEKEVSENIFERFNYADIKTADDYGGMGLGLALSKGIMILLKGDIYVESEPNKGSDFYFEIPEQTALYN
jgi:signal transduction histidine kinase